MEWKIYLKSGMSYIAQKNVQNSTHIRGKIHKKKKLKEQKDSKSSWSPKTKLCIAGAKRSKQRPMTVCRADGAPLHYRFLKGALKYP